MFHFVSTLDALLVPKLDEVKRQSCSSTHGMAASNVVPPSLLCCPTVYEVDVGVVAVQIWPSYQFCYIFVAM